MLFEIYKKKVLQQWELWLWNLKEREELSLNKNSWKKMSFDNFLSITIHKKKKSNMFVDDTSEKFFFYKPENIIIIFIGSWQV